jgi:hypothetical protein
MAHIISGDGGRDQYLEEDTGWLEGDFDLLGGVVLPV